MELSADVIVSIHLQAGSCCALRIEAFAGPKEEQENSKARHAATTW